MPAYVAVAAKFVADFVGAAAINSAAYPLIYATAYYGTEIAITAAVSAGLNAVAQSRIPDPEGSKITRRQPRPPRAYMVGGPSRISGAYMHRETNKNYLGVVLALCEGRLDNISGYYLNDDKVTLTGGGWVVGGDDDRYGYNNDRVLIKTRLGIPTETHYSDMTAKFASTWPTTARGDGIASLMMICNHGKKENFNQDFPNGEPLPSVVAQPVCYDWRDEAQDREDESTWGPCENGVVWLVFIEWYRHGRNWDRCIAPILADLTDEANYCDGSIAKVGGTEPRYRCAGNYLSSTEPDAIRTTLLATFDGWLSFNGKGQMVLKAGRYVEPTFTLTGEHITGYTWRAFQTDEEACNELVVSYVSPDKDFTEVECDAWQDQADILATGRVRSENLQLTWVSYFTQARRLAKRKMSRLNAPRRGQIRTTIHGLNGLGERYIRVQNPELSSMADVVLEVMNVEVDLAAAQVVFDVILADENIDDWDPATEEGGPGGDVTRPPGEALDPPTISTVEVFFDDAGQPRLRVTAYGPDRDDLNWRVGWRVTGDTAFIESTASDLDPSTPVLLETGLVPQGDLEVIVGYETGGGSLVWMDEADAESVNTVSPSVYDPATDVILAEFTTPADDTRAGLYNDLIVALRSAGVLTKLDLLYVFAAHDSQAASVNLIDPVGTKITLSSAPVFTADFGYTGDGVDDYLDTGIPLDALANLSQDSASVGAWVVATGASATHALWGKTTEGFRASATSGGNCNVRINDAANLTMTGTATVQDGFYAVNRSGPTARQGFKNGAQTHSDTQASTTVANENLWFMRLVTSYGALPLGAGFAGASLTATEHAALYTALNTYLTAVGAI